MYGLRKISKDGKNRYNDFAWPLTVDGSPVECPDWDSEPECGGGLHCLPNAIGDWNLLNGHYWAIVKFNKKDMVMIGKGKCKVKKCKLVYLSESPAGLLQYFDHNKFDSKTAYLWARDIGNQDIMIDRITESEYAYWWAKKLGNRDIMIARFPELKDILALNRS